MIYNSFLNKEMFPKIYNITTGQLTNFWSVFSNRRDIDPTRQTRFVIEVVEGKNVLN